MLKNIKRYMKEVNRSSEAPQPPDLVPVTYLLPADYTLFVSIYVMQLLIDIVFTYILHL